MRRYYDAYSRHKMLMNNYLSDKKFPPLPPSTASKKAVTEMDIVRKEHRLVWRDTDGAEDSWEKRVAKRYYDALFKEYAICDLSKSSDLGQMGVRWRVEREVIEGKGQFTCGERKCQAREGLKSWEINFEYEEHGAKKNALVKLRLCPSCTPKLRLCRSNVKEVSPGQLSEEQEITKNETGKPLDKEWISGGKRDETKNRDEEMDEFLADLFL